ncbi:MAG: PaaI family thioesterase [Lentisphaerae bacterium]|nr:PaaI family thioesterase [Lentisphaerota bacterium]
MCVTTERKPSLKALQSRFHAQCLLCGADHPQGLQLAFSTHSDGHVEAPFPCDRLYQGYTGYLHGGVIAALLDSAMTNCLFAHERAALTGELNVRFLKPVLVSRPAIVIARLVESLAPLFKLNGEVRQDGDIMARATAKFMEVRISESGVAPEAAVGHQALRPGVRLFFGREGWMA